MSVEENAAEWIKRQCDFDENFKYNVEILDKYDFSEFLREGMDLWATREMIEEKYDKEFWDKYHLYVFDSLDGEDTAQYFCSRYNIWFQEYTSWVVRHDNGTD